MTIIAKRQNRICQQDNLQFLRPYQTESISWKDLSFLLRISFNNCESICSTDLCGKTGQTLAISTIFLEMQHEIVMSKELRDLRK